jgi:phosphopantothenate synthetase
MKEHHDEVLQNVAQISHEYNELQEFIQLKQMTIVDEIAKFTEDVNRNFDTYINELRETQQKIIEDLEITKHDAQVMRDIQQIIY